MNSDIMSKNPSAPELTDLIRSIKEDIFRSLNSVKIGKIFSFDQVKKTAQIQLLFKRSLTDKTVSYPVLVDCPVFTLQGGGGSLRMPIKKGDPCLVLFADRNIDNWYSAGAEAAPANSRCHDIADGIALVGLNSLADSMANYDDNVNLTIPATKKLVVDGGASAEILGTAALALISELNAFITSFNSHTHSGVTTGLGASGAPVVTIASKTGTTKLKGS